MGALESLGALSPAVGLSLGGALVALSSPRTAFLVVGIGAISHDDRVRARAPGCTRRRGRLGGVRWRLLDAERGRREGGERAGRRPSAR